MINKSIYLQMKRDMKCYCRSHILTLCDNVELNDYEKELVLYFYDNKSVQQACMDFGISAPTYNISMKTIFSKIYDYKNTH